MVATGRRRILVLTPRDPYPVIGGDRLRIHRLARELAQHHDLTLLTFCTNDAERSAPLPDDGVFKEVHRVVIPRWRSLLNVIGALPRRNVPLQVAYYRSSKFREAVAALAPSHDAVIAHLVRTAPYAAHLPIPRVLEMTDAISMSMERVSRTRLGYFDIRRFVYGVEAGRLREYERHIARSFDIVTLNSMADRAFAFDASRDNHASVMVLPNGNDAVEGVLPGQAARNPGEIVFVGNLHSLQNFDAAWFFARHALPLIREKRPDAYLRVIGSIRQGAMLKLAALPGVIVEGFVPSLTRALATARVGVCAARIGSGMQNKVLDYLGNGLAVVCSTTALEGIDAHPEQHLLKADLPGEWAHQVLRLLDDEALAQRLADAGRDLVCRRYRWDRCVFPLLNRLNSLLDRQSPPLGVADISSDIEDTSWPIATAPVPRSRSSAT